MQQYLRWLVVILLPMVIDANSAELPVSNPNKASGLGYCRSVQDKDAVKQHKKAVETVNFDDLMIVEPQSRGFNLRSAEYFTNKAQQECKSHISIIYNNQVFYVPPLGLIEQAGEKQSNIEYITKYIGMVRNTASATSCIINIEDDPTKLWQALSEKNWSGLEYLEIYDKSGKFIKDWYAKVPDIFKKLPKVAIILKEGSSQAVADLFTHFANSNSFIVQIASEKLPRVVLNREQSDTLPKGKLVLKGQFYNPDGSNFSKLWEVLAKQDLSNIYELNITDANVSLDPTRYSVLAHLPNIKRLAVGGLNSNTKDVLKLLSLWGQGDRKLDFYYVNFADQTDNVSDKKQKLSFGVNTENNLQLPHISPSSIDDLATALKIINPNKIDGLILPFAKLGHVPENLVKQVLSYCDKNGWVNLSALELYINEPFHEAFLAFNKNVLPNLNSLTVRCEKIENDYLEQFITGFNPLQHLSIYSHYDLTKEAENLLIRDDNYREKLIKTYTSIFKAHPNLGWLELSVDLTNPMCLVEFNHTGMIISNEFKVMVSSMSSNIQVLKLEEVHFTEEVAEMLSQQMPNLKYLIGKTFHVVAKENCHIYSTVQHFSKFKNLHGIGAAFKFRDEVDSGTIAITNQSIANKYTDEIAATLKQRTSNNMTGRLFVMAPDQFSKISTKLKLNILSKAKSNTNA